MVRIALDAMGSDNYPTPDVIGGVMAARAFNVEVILVGDKDLIDPVLKTQDLSGIKVSVEHAPEMLTMNDKGDALVLKARHKESKNSMAVGMDLVKAGNADAFVTAGNTGAAWVTAFFRLGRLRGVSKPALAVIFPTATGSCVVLDIGANPDCEPDNLVQFAKMGAAYAEKLRGIKDPKVGVISNGEEEGKGNKLVREATPKLKEAGLNFVGNIEGKEMIGGAVDVAVTDGFTGNVVLKTSEAIGKLIIDSIKNVISNGNILVKIGGLLVKPALKKLKSIIDPSEEGAAPLLGINGLVFVGHGRSDAQAIQNAVRVAKVAVDSELLEAIKEKIK